MKYNSTGINIELFRNILFHNEDFVKFIDIPKPLTVGELDMLSEFIFGERLHLENFFIVHRTFDRSMIKGKTINNLISSDYEKLSYPLADITFKVDKPVNSYRDKKFLRELDSEFNYNFDAFELIFWRSVFGNDKMVLSLENHCQGKFKIYSISDYVNINLWISNTNNYTTKHIVREEFRKQIKKLKDIDSIFIV